MKSKKDKITERREELQRELDALEKELEGLSLLQDVWLELGPYSPALSNELRHKLQDFFGFDDSE